MVSVKKDKNKAITKRCPEAKPLYLNAYKQRGATFLKYGLNFSLFLT